MWGRKERFSSTLTHKYFANSFAGRWTFPRDVTNAVMLLGWRVPTLENNRMQDFSTLMTSLLASHPQISLFYDVFKLLLEWRHIVSVTGHCSVVSKCYKCSSCSLVMSSDVWSKQRLQHFGSSWFGLRIRVRSFTWTKNKRGQRIDPWGTPNFTVESVLRGRHQCRCTYFEGKIQTIVGLSFSLQYVAAFPVRLYDPYCQMISWCQSI